MKYTLLVLAIFSCNDLYGQQFPVSCFKMYSAVTNETPLTHVQQLAKTFPQYQDAAFNYGQAFIQKYYYWGAPTLTDAETRQLLDSAAAHNVNMILNSVVDYYAAAERFYFDANANYFNTINGTPTNDPSSEFPYSDPNYYDQKSLPATRLSRF